MKKNKKLENKYKKYVKKRNKIKKELISLRNNQYDVKVAIKELYACQERNNQEIDALYKDTNLLSSENQSKDIYTLRAEKYNTDWDICSLIKSFEEDIIHLNDMIKKDTKKYQKIANKIKRYKKELKHKK